MGKIAELKSILFEGKIAQEQMKRAEVRGDGKRTTFPNSAKNFNLSKDDMIGWFSNAHNPVDGWVIFDTTPDEKKEFGEDAFRTYSEKTDSTSIIKFNLMTGTYSFIDNKAYADDGIVKFEKASPYKKLMIDGTEKAFKIFNIV